MSNIEFEADAQNNPHYGAVGKSGFNISGAPQQPGMVKWLTSHGILSSDSAAKSFLIGVVVVNFVANALILYFYVLR